MSLNSQARRLFDQLVDLSPADRLKHLAQAAIAPELRAEVESLLHFDTTGSHTLGQAVAAAAARMLAPISADPDATRSMDLSARLPNPGQPLAPGECPGGTYRLVRLLGEGGMGRVYEAEQLATGRVVAIKFLNETDGANPAEKDRLLREGRLAASISHPNSVFVFGTEEIGGTFAIVMELVGGGTLKQRIEHGPVPLDESLKIALQLLDGLEAAHRAGVLHRDIKPSNCFLEPDGTAKLGDYGISRPTQKLGNSTTFTVGSFAGTPTYASPEQMQGEELDARADIYSLGATLFHLLTGHPPFEQRDMVQLISAVIGKAPESPQTFRPEISPELAAIVLRCLEKDKFKRFQTVDELRTSLQALVQIRQPAKAWQRLVAYWIDGLPPTLIATFAFGELQSLVYVGRQAICWFVALVLYGLWEGIKGTTPGKRLLGLRVTNRHGGTLGPWRGIARSLIFASPWLGLVVLPEPWPGDLIWTTAGLLLFAAGVPVLFLPTVWKKRFYGFHDLLTQSIVTHSPAPDRNPDQTRLHPQDKSPVQNPIPVGPFQASALVCTFEGKNVWDGWDPILRRRLWIIIHPPGTPPTLPDRRDLRRPARLRWLAGQRSSDIEWDAYEQPVGTALSAISARQEWPTIARWFQAIVNEVELAEEPLPLSPERIWIADSGAAILLDFPVACGEHIFPSVAELLRAVAPRLGISAENGSPAHALRLLEGISANPGLPLTAESLRKIPSQRAGGFRNKRLIQLCLANYALCWTVLYMLPVFHFDKLLARNELMVFSIRLDAWDVLKPRVANDWRAFLWFKHQRFLKQPEAAQMRVRLGLTNGPPATWSDADLALLADEYETLTEDRVLGMRIGIAISLFATPALACLLALLLKGFVSFLICQFELSQRDGRPAGRFTVVSRAVICQLPGVAATISINAYFPGSPPLAHIAPLLIYPLCFIWGIFRPHRAPADYLFGTYVLPK